MPGMGGSSFSSTNPLVVAMFHHNAFETSVSWIIALALVLLVVASILRRVNSFNLSSGGLGEARSRTYLRMAFGAIWLIDGILQFQASMPLGMANGIVAPGAGGIFQSTNTILFGWPGASLFYLVAGVWLALPSANFPARFSRYTLRGLSVLAVIGVLLQTLPSRGFWHGGNTNAMTVMSTNMSATSQPHALAWIVRHFGEFAGTVGGGFNVIVIIWLGVCAVGLWMASDRDLRWPTRTFVIGCHFFWLVAQDAPFWGGLATDVNSLIPLAVLAWCASPARVHPRMER